MKSRRQCERQFRKHFEKTFTIYELNIAITINMRNKFIIKSLKFIKNHWIEHCDDVNYAQWIRWRKKKRLRIWLKWSYRAKCNAYSQYSFYKIFYLFLSDLKHQIQQKNFFFIKKILLKIFNEFNAIAIWWRMLF